MDMLKQYYLSQAKAVFDDYFAKSGEKAYFRGQDKLVRNLALLLERIEAHSVNMMLLNRIIDNGLLAAYLDSSTEKKEHVEKISQDFAANLAQNGKEIIKAACPKLHKYVKKAETQHIDALDDFFTRFEQDTAQISETFFNGHAIETITELDAGCGDTHNHGRSVIIAETNAGKFVYKPHDISIDAWGAQFFAKFFPDVCVLPKTIVRNGYGYCEYVSNSPANTAEQTAIYYRNLGGLCAVSHLLGSRDLHCENILSDGTHPIPVDMEMTVSSGNSKQDFSQDNSPNHINHTVLSTGFLPFRIGEKEISILFSESDSNRACPVADNKKVTATNFRDDFINGFEQAYKVALAQKEQIREYIENMPDMAVRVLLRATQPYAKLVYKTHEWGWMQDANVKDRIREALALAFTKAGISVNDEIIASEVAAVAENNVPYFYTRTKGRDIYDADGVLTQDYFETSTVENTLANFDVISEEDMLFQSEILKKCFSRQIKNVSTNYILDVPEIKSFDFVLEAEKIFEQIMDDSIYVTTDEGRFPLWFVKDKNYSTAMSATLPELFCGTVGIALFAAALSRMTNNEELRQQAEKLYSDQLSQMLEYARAFENFDKICENMCSSGLASGLAGLLHANELIYGYTNNPLCLQVRGSLLAMLPKMDYTFAQNDFVAGLAGMLCVLCKYDCLYEAPKVAEEVQKIADSLLARRKDMQGMLLWQTISPRALSGFGHGQAGIAYALCAAAKRLGKDEYIKAAEDAYLFEDRAFSPELNGWPDFRHTDKATVAMHGYCSGAPGIGLVMMSLGTELGRRNLERAINCCMGHPLLYADYLCCGNSAAADFLLEAGQRLKRKDLSAKASEIVERLLTRAQQNGELLLVNPKYENFFEPSLFYGAAGVGYTCLRRAAPDIIKCILAL